MASHCWRDVVRTLLQVMNRKGPTGPTNIQFPIHCHRPLAICRLYRSFPTGTFWQSPLPTVHVRSWTLSWLPAIVRIGPSEKGGNKLTNFTGKKCTCPKAKLELSTFFQPQKSLNMVPEMTQNGLSCSMLFPGSFHEHLPMTASNSPGWWEDPPVSQGGASTNTPRSMFMTVRDPKRMKNNIRMAMTQLSSQCQKFWAGWRWESFLQHLFASFGRVMLHKRLECCSTTTSRHFKRTPFSIIGFRWI